MKKRLRKKKRIREFQIFGFSTGFISNAELDIESGNGLIDRFIEEAIENNGLQFGGGGSGFEWDGNVSTDQPRSSAANLAQEAIRQWYMLQPEIIQYFLTPLIDAWHGDFDSVEIEWIKKQNEPKIQNISHRRWVDW